jgi:hypothetical protein
MSKLYLQSIECSAQPLDLSFHPTLDYLVAAALVDGTVEGTFKEIWFGRVLLTPLEFKE